jgi:hypothetical protein
MTPEAEAEWEKMVDAAVDAAVDPHLQRVAVDVIEYLREKLYDDQVLSSVVNREKNRYEVILHDVPKPFWDAVLKPELKHIAKRYNYVFAYGVTQSTVKKGILFDMTARR